MVVVSKLEKLKLLKLSKLKEKYLNKKKKLDIWYRKKAAGIDKKFKIPLTAERVKETQES